MTTTDRLYAACQRAVDRLTPICGRLNHGELCRLIGGVVAECAAALREHEAEKPCRRLYDATLLFARSSGDASYEADIRAIGERFEIGGEG